MSLSLYIYIDRGRCTPSKWVYMRIPKINLNLFELQLASSVGPVGSTYQTVGHFGA